MPSHSDRRLTLRWAKSGPPRAVVSGSPSGSVALLVRATSPACATRLAEKLPASITGCQIGRKVLYGWCYGYLVAKIATFVILARCLLAARRLR